MDLTLDELTLIKHALKGRTEQFMGAIETTQMSDANADLLRRDIEECLVLIGKVSQLIRKG